MAEAQVTAVEQRPELTVVRILVESLDEGQLDQLQKAVRDAADANPVRPLVLEFSQVGFVPSLSLATIIRLHTELRSRGQRLVLVGLRPSVREVFVITRLDRLLELQDDLAAAERSVRAGG